MSRVPRAVAFGVGGAAAASPHRVDVDVWAFGVWNVAVWVSSSRGHL
jgi:hypothetical protein